jgi:outer membrane usher protein
LVQVQRNLPLGPGIAYRAIAASDRMDGTITASSRTGTGELEAARTNGTSAVRAGMRGAVGWIRNRFLLTRTIDDAFAVVTVGRFAGVRVLADNQPVGVADQHGVAIVPRLRSFQSNRISVDPRDLPLDAFVEALEIVVRPARRAGIRVDFPIAEANGVLVRLANASGGAVPVGATVIVEGGSAEFPVAREGAVYLTGLQAGRVELNAQWPGGSCSATLRVTKEDLRAGVEMSAKCLKERKP